MREITIGEQVREYKARALATGKPEDVVIAVPPVIGSRAGEYAEILEFVSSTNEAPRWMVDIANELVTAGLSRRGGAPHWAFILADKLAPFARWKPGPNTPPRSDDEWQRDVRHCLESVCLTSPDVPACVSQPTDERVVAAARELARECTKSGKRKTGWGLAVVIANELGWTLEKKLAKAKRARGKSRTA